MSSQITPRSHYIWLAVLIIGLALLLLIALTDPGFAAPETPAWHFQASAQANCAQDNLTAEVGWTFWNRDTRTMRVTVSLPDGTNEVRDVAPGAIEVGTFTGLAQPLAAGSVRFDMAWTSGGGTDSATRSYAAVSCIPTAVRLASFGAAPGGPEGPDALTCPRGYYPAYVCRYTRVCVFNRCRYICTGYSLYCRR